MINGRYDFIFPRGKTRNSRCTDGWEPVKRTSDTHLFDSGHLPHRNDVIRETLNWLDNRLGPVR